MNSIDYFKQDISVGDIATIELTTGKTVTGKVIEISGCVLIEKEDGKTMRLLDGIIGGWELKEPKIGKSALQESSIEDNGDDILIEEKKTAETNPETISAEGERQEQDLAPEDEEEDDDDDDAEEEDDSETIEGLLGVSGDSLLNSNSLKLAKREVQDIFDELFTMARVKDEALTPTNAKAYETDGIRIYAKLDNGNLIKFTRSTLVGFNKVHDSIDTCEVFSTSIGNQNSPIKSKRNLVKMTYGELRAIFYDAVEKANYGQSMRIARTIVKFPEMTGFQSSFKKLFSSLIKLRTIKSFVATNDSLSESQKRLLYSFVSNYMMQKPSDRINHGALRSAVISSLGLKASKVYLTYLTRLVLSNKIQDKSNGERNDTGKEVSSESSDSGESIKYEAMSPEERERIRHDFLQDYKQIIIASGLRANGIVGTNAKYIGESEYSTDLGIALTDNGETVYIRKTGFVGDPNIHLREGSAIFVRYRPNTGDSVTTIGLMTYNALNQYYAASIKNETFWEAITILTYLLHSVPETNNQNDDIRRLLAQLMFIVQERYPKEEVKTLGRENRSWLEAFIKFKVATEDVREPVSDEKIRDLFLRRYNILLPVVYVTITRSALDIADPSGRIVHTPKPILPPKEEHEEDLLAMLSEVFASLQIDLKAPLPTNAVLINEGIGSGIKAKTDDNRMLTIQGEFYAGNPLSILTGGVRVYTKPQPSGICYITIEGMSYEGLLEFCKNKIANNSYQEIVNVVKGLRSIKVFESADDSLKTIYNEAKRRVKREIRKSLRTYEDLSEEEKAGIYSFVKESINLEDTNNPLSDFQIVNAYNEKYGILLHTSVISTIRRDLGISSDTDRRIESSSVVIESNCYIDKYFAWYNNGAAHNSSNPEIRFKDEVVDPLLLSELKNYRKGDPAIPAVCGIQSEGRYTVASFVVRPGKLSDIYQTARLFETAGNISVANAIKSFIANYANTVPSKESSHPVSYSKARELRLSHDYTGAEEILLSLIRSKYQLDTVVKDLADMYREIGHLDRALSLMETHLDSLENKLKAYNFLSNLYVANGDYGNSIIYLKKAYNLIAPKDKDIKVRCLLTIANQSIVLKDTVTAKEVLQEALSIKPGFKKAKELLDKLNRDKPSIGKLTRVLSFKAPAFIENDLKLSNYKALSEKAAEYLIKAKEYQENLDQANYRNMLLAYVQTRCIDLLKCDRVSSAQEYMLCGQAINNTGVDYFGILLLQSQIVRDPVVLTEHDMPSDFSSFLANYSPNAQCERILYRFLKCFEASSVHNVMTTLFENEEWHQWICGLIGTQTTDQRLFRETLMKKADWHEKHLHDVVTSLEETTKLGNSYDMSKKIIGLLSADCIKSLNDVDSAVLANLSKIVQSVNGIQKIDDYHVCEERTQSLKKNIEDSINDITNKPTRISSLYVIPVLEKCSYLLDENLQRLSIDKAPELSIVSGSNARVNGETCHVQLKMSNKSGHSKIVSASVRITNINGRDVSEKQYIYNHRSPLYGGKCSTFEIVISLNQKDLSLRILNLILSVTYFDKDSAESTKHEPLEIRIDDSHDFKPYENKFVKWANGQEVSDIDMVKGRDTLINTISETALNDRKSFIIYGQRRSGKSTVLHHVWKKLQESKQCFVVKMSVLSLSGKDNDEQSFLGDLYFQILTEISRQIKLENRVVYRKVFGYNLECDEFLNNPNMRFTYYLDKVKDVLLEELGYKEDRIILIIDEFTTLYQEILDNHITDTFIKKTKELSESGSITFVVSGHDVMPKFWERFPNELGIFKKEPVTSIDEKSARELVEEPVWDKDNDRSRFEQDAVTRIIELSGYNPFYIQILCAEIVDYALKNSIPVITEYDVNVVVNRMTSSETKLRRGDFDNLIPVKDNKVFHERVFELSIDDAYSIVKEIAQFENEFVADSSLHAIKKTEKKKVLSYLLSRDVLEPHPDYGRELVKIKVSLFKEWLRKNE